MVARDRVVTVHLTRAIDLYRAMDMTFWLPETEAALAQVKEGCSEGSVTRLHCETLRPTPSHKSCRTCLPTCPSVHIFPVFYAYCISRRNFFGGK